MTESGEKRKKILVVEDDFIQRTFLSKVVLSLGYESVEAGSGDAAEQQINNESLDIVLLDWELGDTSGLKLIQKWSKDPVLRWMPVIMVTGRHDASQLQEALDAGAIDFVRKPFKPIELAARIRSALRIKKLQDDLRLMSIVDPLTGLYNRRYFDERLAGEAERSKRYGHSLVFCIIDIDFFKKINDSFGHDVGDKVLQNVAAILKNGVRKCDIAARWGGEEFTIILTGTTPLLALECINRLKQDVRKFDWSALNGDLNVTFSAGISFFGACPDDTTQLMMKRADKSLYAAKAGGRDRIEMS